jgi:hypothetical protein
MAAAAVDVATLPLLGDTLLDTPVPAPGETGAPLPRFRAELGPFIGLYAGGRTALAANGFTSSSVWQPVGSLEVGVRAGIGFEHLIGSSGLSFIQAGIVNESSRVDHCSEADCTGDYTHDSLVPHVPARTGLGFRIQLPFWLVPFDLLIAGPFVALASPNAFRQMAILAGGGGLIPWQSDFRTVIGTFQFIVGRSVGVTLYGYLGGPTATVTPIMKDAQGAQRSAIVDLRTVEFELPLVQYRPFHEFAMRQAFAMNVELGYAIDVPTSVKLRDAPGIPPPSLTPAHMATLRLVFDVRQYF